ncbi:MAG: methyltransferase domain-containing protein [Acidobacteria bacterium]|nr:methyltransferase domain-containing protein [Acidobacteriota bacterium]
MRLFRGGTRADPALCDKDFLFLRSLSRAIASAAEESDLPPGSVILDVGSTRKPYQELLSQKAASGRFYALDVEPVEGHMLDVAGVVEALPFRTSSADCCLCTQVLEHVEDPQAVLAELSRVLRPGGLLLLSTHGVFHHHPYPHDYWRWTHEGLEKILGEHFGNVLQVEPNGGTLLLLFHILGRGVFYLSRRFWLLGSLRYSLYPLLNLLGLVTDTVIRDRSVVLNYLAIAVK